MYVYVAIIIVNVYSCSELRHNCHAPPPPSAGVRQKGEQLQQFDQWMKPEVRSNLGENLTLNDPIKISREIDCEREARTGLWQRAHSKSLLLSYMETCP